MRLKKDFTFSDGGTIKVHEVSQSDLDVLEQLSLDANENKYEDLSLSTFAKQIYPLLAACTDNSPSLEEAYKKEPCDLDNWYLLAHQVNVAYFNKLVYSEREIKLDG